MTKDDTLIHESEWTIRYGQAEWAEWVIAVISMTQELKKKSRPVIATAALISYIFASAAIWSLNHRYGLDKPVPDCGWCGPGNGP